MDTIILENLSKFYGSSVGIKDVSLKVKNQEIFGFIGPNGSGKSTTIRTILGLILPTSGKAKIFGEDVFSHGPELRKRIGYLPSEVNFYGDMTSFELLEYHAGFYNKKDSTLIFKLAELFELDLKKKINELSFGNKKKCAIIQTVVHQPDLIILDEPTAGLDPLMQNRFFELIESENKRGATIFFSSHILSEIQRLCDRAAIIRNGEIITIEDIQDLLKKQMKKCSIVFKNKPEDLNLPKGVQNEKWHGNKFTFDYIGEIDPLVDWMASHSIQDAAMEEPDLESIFMNYYLR